MDISILCEEFCEYSTTIKGYTKETLRRYRYAIHSFAKIEAITEIDQVSEEKLRHLFYHGRTVRNWSVHTYIVYYKTLLVFFRWCIKQGYMHENPIETIEIPKLEKKLPVRITKQDALKLLEIVNNYPYQHKFVRHRNHAIFATFIFAGLRKQELLNLKYSDVDLENLTLFIRQGKGNKDRIIPISYSLAQSLKRYTAERKRLSKTNPEFFSSLTHNAGYSDSGLRKLAEQVVSASNIKFSVHKLRHTFATLMLEGGCDIYSLSKMMGHSDINTTTIYLSATAEHLRAQIIKHPLNKVLIDN